MLNSKQARTALHRKRCCDQNCTIWIVLDHLYVKSDVIKSGVEQEEKLGSTFQDLYCIVLDTESDINVKIGVLLKIYVLNPS